MPGHPHIRTATPDDADQLATLATRTFRDTFAADNSAADMKAYVRDSFSLERVQAELADHANTFVLAFANGEEQPSGYAKLRTGTANPSVTGPDPVELALRATRSWWNCRGEASPCSA